MGVFDLLTFPVLGPLRGVVWLAETIQDVAETEWYDTDRIRAQLIELELAYDLGEIDAEEYLTQEDALLQRLSEAQERQEQQ